MQNILLDFDSALFQLLNGMLTSPPTDLLFTFITSTKYTWPIYLSFAFYIAYRYKKKGFVSLFALALTLGITDQFSTHVLKPTFNRERPCMQEANVRLLIPCGPGQSFLLLMQSTMAAWQCLSACCSRIFDYQSSSWRCWLVIQEYM